jgi:hypothetical protein
MAIKTKKEDEILMTLQRLNGLPSSAIAKQNGVSLSHVKKTVRSILRECSGMSHPPHLSEVTNDLDHWRSLIDRYSIKLGINHEQNFCQVCKCEPVSIEEIDELGAPVFFCSVYCRDYYNTR